jgi:uncharacterized membrane protein YdfJ with MMPL/SSD domain
VTGGLRRLGRLTARHPVVTVVAWLVIAIAMVAWVRIVGAQTNNTLTLPGTDSQAAYDLLAAEFPPEQNGTNPFVFHVDHGTLSDPEYAPAVDATFKAIKANPDVASVRNPIGKNAEAAGIISEDGRTGIMPVLLKVGSGFITPELAHKVLAATAPARHAGIDVAVGGSIGSILSAPDTSTSELLGNLSAMVILALVFGSFVAMGLPIVNAAVGLAIGTAVVGLLGHIATVPTVAHTLAVMIGLGVGIDYALFLITKHQEQLAGGADVLDSIADTVASSGSAIVFAGGTVVIALASLAVARIPLVMMLGFASAIAVFLAVLTSLTLLPAILSLVGTGVNRLRTPSFLRLRPRPPGARRWDRWARWVGVHPWIAISISVAILAPLTVPLFSLELGQPDVGVAPTSTTQRQAYDLTTHGFGVGYNGPLLVAMSFDPVAKPSAAYTKKYDEATALQHDLKQTQRQLTRQKADLQRQQEELEAQKASLERQGAALRRQQAELEAQAAALQRQQDRVRAQAATLATRARTLARRIAPLAAHLAAIKAHERIVQGRIDHTTNPRRLYRLFVRLRRLQAREVAVRARLAPLVARGRRLAQQGIALAQQEAQLSREANQLQRQAAGLQRRADELRAQQRSLESQATALQRQADELRAQAAAAKKEKQHALALKHQLTRMLTAAGGDPRGTDPRLVSIQHAVSGTDGVVAISPPQINHPGDAVIMTAISVHAPSSDATAALVTALRSDTLPPVTGADGVVAHVGGTTATYVDLARTIASRMAIVVLTVLGLSFVFLLAAFRSLLVPLQAAVTNLLSVAAALGVLTAIFQWGWGLSWIGLDAPHGTVPIASYVPLMMFAVLFGLSMDYEVFTVSRIQQRHAEGADPTMAVTSGLGSAAHVVTSAALIMFLVFASFIINGDPTIKQFGVGLATAVALAGIMVVLLAPALLTLFGRALFWLPPRLSSVLPHLDVEGAGGPAPQPVASAEVEAAREAAPPGDRL